MADRGAITFAVVGRDEAATLGRALAQAFGAARSGDEVWFVDSASSDGSAAVARGYANIPAIARDATRALLDLGERHGRLRGGRAAWRDWADAVIAVIDAQPPEGSDESEYLAALRAAAARPLPA